MSYKGVAQEEFVRRIFSREDNLYLKKEFIKDVVAMYNQEIRKALMDGENVNIKDVGSIIPEIHRRNGGCPLPTVADINEELLPYINIRFHKNEKFKEAITGKLRKNYLENDKLELKDGRPLIPKR